MSTSLRIKGTVNGVETIYLGSYYAKSGSTIKTFYYAGGSLFNIPTFPRIVYLREVSFYK